MFKRISNKIYLILHSTTEMYQNFIQRTYVLAHYTSLKFAIPHSLILPVRLLSVIRMLRTKSDACAIESITQL